MSYWLKDAFKAEQAEWYERLKSEGFEDAEELVNGKLELKQCASRHYYQNVDELQRETKEAYFSLISHYVQTEDFDNGIDKLIMSLYAEGYSKSRIVEVLRRLPPRRPPHFVSDLYRSRKTVWYRICLYEMRWGLRAESPRYSAGYSAPGDRHKKVS